MKNSKILAIIPARGGSKGIPKKNIADLCGNPLIHYTIDAALKSNIFDEIIVSSDDPKILDISTRKGVSVIVRPEIISGDSVTTNEVISYLLQNTVKNKYDYIAVLQPTSPLRNETHIKEAYLKFIKNPDLTLISVCIPKQHPFKSYVITKDGLLEGAFSSSAPFKPRQSLPEVLIPNGAIYLFSTDAFLKDSCIPEKKLVPFIMRDEESIDIDSFLDLKIANYLMDGK